MQSPAPGNPGQQQQRPGMHTFRRGQVLAGRYAIVDVVGRGGMGCIYRVHDNTLNEQVALKTLLPQFVSDKLVVERFFNEARIARQLSHPNIVRVHDIGSAENVVYISMEYLKGRSLRAMLDQLPAGQRLPITTTLQLMIQLCGALEYAHQFTVHRDIKPENVMIMEDGSIKLMDFGISKLMTSGNLTATAVIMGTPHYMSPEQLKDSRNVDVRADIYSIGVMLYEILTGNLPTGVPKPASQLMMEVPPALDPIVAKCVEPKPDDRYLSVSELKAELRSVLTLVEEGGSLPMKKPGPSRPGISVPWVRIGGIALIVGILALVAVGFKGLEGYRKEVLEKAASAPTLSPATAPNSSANAFERLLQVAQSAQRASAGVESDESIARLQERGKQLLDVAEREQEAGETDKAMQDARHALQYFLATLPTKPEGVVFVPPADGADGFYIDSQPVTEAQFLQFSASVPGGWRALGPDAALASDLPVAGVTYYDALAYASANDARLPTASEWKRAFEADAHSLADGVYEWTCTLLDPPPTGSRAPTFGDALIVLGASAGEDGEVSETQPAQLRYEQRDPNTGFRCVHDIPTDPEQAQRLIR
jgi:serine/threonine protein kinase